MDEKIFVYAPKRKIDNILYGIAFFFIEIKFVHDILVFQIYVQIGIQLSLFYDKMNSFLTYRTMKMIVMYQTDERVNDLSLYQKCKPSQKVEKNSHPNQLPLSCFHQCKRVEVKVKVFVT